MAADGWAGQHKEATCEPMRRVSVGVSFLLRGMSRKEKANVLAGAARDERGVVQRTRADGQVLFITV